LAGRQWFRRGAARWVGARALTAQWAHGEVCIIVCVCEAVVVVVCVSARETR
jgi:hypothetical protein